MPTNARKATFSVHAEVLAALDEAVVQGNAPSKNAFVERALIRKLEELRRVGRGKQWQEASQDPVFLKDLGELEAAFKSADAETARTQLQWALIEADLDPVVGSERSGRPGADSQR